MLIKDPLFEDSSYTTTVGFFQSYWLCQCGRGEYRPRESTRVRAEAQKAPTWTDKTTVKAPGRSRLPLRVCYGHHIPQRYSAILIKQRICFSEPLNMDRACSNIVLETLIIFHTNEENSFLSYSVLRWNLYFVLLYASSAHSYLLVDRDDLFVLTLALWQSHRRDKRIV